MYITSSRWQITGGRRGNEQLYFSWIPAPGQTHCTHFAGLLSRTHTLGMLTQSYRLIHIGLESRLFHVRGLTAPSLDPWVSLCHWEVLGRLTDTGFNLLKQSYKDWKRCLPAHQNADTHTRAWGAWAIRETHYHQMNKGETVIPSESPNPGSWRSAHCLTRDQNSPPKPCVLWRKNTKTAQKAKGTRTSRTNE